MQLGPRSQGQLYIPVHVSVGIYYVECMTPDFVCTQFLCSVLLVYLQVMESHDEGDLDDVHQMDSLQALMRRETPPAGWCQHHVSPQRRSDIALSLVVYYTASSHNVPHGPPVDFVISGLQPCGLTLRTHLWTILCRDVASHSYRTLCLKLTSRYRPMQ